MKTQEIRSWLDNTLLYSTKVEDGDAFPVRTALERAVLAGKCLGLADLAGAHLIGANLTGAHLTGARLTGANLAGASLAYARLAGARLGYANLYGVNLAYANLIGADLTGTRLWRADLIGADLVNADIYGANLAGAPISGEVGTRLMLDADDAELLVRVRNDVEDDDFDDSQRDAKLTLLDRLIGYAMQAAAAAAADVADAATAAPEGRRVQLIADAMGELAAALRIRPAGES